MTDYGTWTKRRLIERLQSLESGEQPVEHALRESEARMRAILDTAVEGIVTINDRGIIELFNPAAERIFGYEAEELIGEKLNVLMPVPYSIEHDDYIERYLNTGHPRIIGVGREVQGRRKDGSIFPMDLSVSEVRLPDKHLFTGFVRDLSDRVRLEREVLRISEVEQRRIGQDLHDGVCQQLAGIELMSQSMAQLVAKQAPTAAKQANAIGDHIRDAIADTRMLAHGLCPVMLESEGLMAALQQLTVTAERMYGLKCTFRCDVPVLLNDHAAAVHLYRIAQEAVSNACRHAEAQNIGVRLSTTPGRVRLAIHDDGDGISKSARHPAGMGLRIMEYRVAMIGGTLEIEKGTKGGTTVVCTAKYNQP